MERNEAAYALEAAVEIFGEQHLKTLAKGAQALMVSKDIPPCSLWPD